MNIWKNKGLIRPIFVLILENRVLYSEVIFCWILDLLLVTSTGTKNILHVFDGLQCMTPVDKDVNILVSFVVFVPSILILNCLKNQVIITFKHKTV